MDKKHLISFFLTVSCKAFILDKTSFFISILFSSDANSFNYYAKIKGKLEQAISDIGFEQVTIARPGHLLGLREESRGVEIPILETGLKLAEPFMQGPLKNFRQIEASKVAAAMVRVTNTDRSGKQILHFNDFVS